MEDKPLFTQPTTDLFSTAVLAAKGKGKKTPATGPISGRVQGKQGGNELPSLMSLNLRGTGSVVDSLANDSMSKRDPTIANVNMHKVETSKHDDRRDFELLKQKIFAARMMGAPATVANDIVSSFHMKESSSSSSFSLGSQQGISTSPVQSQAGSFTQQQQQQQQQITASVPPAQQAQARIIAAALFNSIKPILPATSVTTTETNPEQQQQQHLPAKLQETLAQIKVQQEQQDAKLLEEKQDFQTPLQKTLSLLRLAQLQQQPVTSQQQQSSEKTIPFSAVGQSQPQKWSNRSQKAAVFQTGKVTDKLGKPSSSSSSSSTWSTDSILTTSNLSTLNPQYTPVKSATDILNIIKQRDPRLSAAVDHNLTNTVVSRPNLAKEPVVLSVIEPPKLNLLGKVPVSVGSPSIQTIEVLESLKNDGYIDSPPVNKTSCVIDQPKGKILDKNSTSWQGASVVGNWKTPKPVPKPKELRLNRHAETKTTSSSQAPMSSINFQGALPGQKQTRHITEPVNKSMDAWQDSVDAFLQVTNRSDEGKWKTAESRGRKRLHETQPIVVPTTRLFTPAAQAETPFLSETDTEETISIIDRRVEMLRMQKVQILQDQMEEFYREIQEFDKEIEESQPASKQRKKKKNDQGLTSYDKDKGNYRQKELEKYQERESDKRRERDKGGDDDRRRRNEKRSASKPKRSLSRDRDEKRLRSPNYQREESRKRESSRKSREGASPKRARSRSREDTAKDSKSPKDAPMEMRQGRYPSKYGERRTSVSPERKRKKIEAKTETFREGRWQFASKVFDRRRGFRLGFGREKKKIEIRLKRSDTKKEDKKEKKEASSKTTYKSSKIIDTEGTKSEKKKDNSSIKKTDTSSSDSKSSVSRTAFNPQQESSETPKSDINIKISTSTDPVSKSSTRSSSVSVESTKPQALTPSIDTESSNSTSSSIILSPVVCSTAASNSSTTVSTSSSSALTNNAMVLKPSTNRSKLATSNSSTSASSSKAVTKGSTASTNISTASTSSSKSKLSMSSSKTAVSSSISSTHSSTTSTKMSTPTKVHIPSTSKRIPNKPTVESSTTGDDTKDSVDEPQAKMKKKAEVELSTDADATLASSSLADEIKESSISHQLGLLKQLQLDKHVEDKVLVDWFCYVCGTICHTLKVYTMHIAGRKHKTIYEKLLGSTNRSGIKNKLISKLKMLPMKDADPMTIANMAEALRGNLSNIPSVTSGTPLTESRQSFQCGRCFRPYTCSYQEHLLSEEHKKFEKIRPRCNVCNMIFQKIIQYRKHLNSPSHKKKAQAMATSVGKLQKTAMEDYKSKSDNSNNSDKPGLKTHLIGSEFVIPISGFFCKLCSKFYNKEKTAKDVHCATSHHISKAKQYYASRNQSTGTSFKASLGIVNETKPPGAVKEAKTLGAVKEAKTLGASIVMKTPKTVSTAPPFYKHVPPRMNVLMKSKSLETCASIRDSSEGKSVGGIPPRKVPTVENQVMSIPSRVSVRLSGRKTRSATAKIGSLITVTKYTDVPDTKASGETHMETAMTTTKNNAATPGEEVLSGKTQLKELSFKTAVPIRTKPNQRGSQEIVPVVAQNPQTIRKETKMDNINLKDFEQAQETTSKASTPRRDKPKDASPKDVPSKEQAQQTSKTSDLKEIHPITSPKRGTPARAQTMRTRSNKVTPHEDVTNVKSNSSPITVMGTSASIGLEVSTEPLTLTKVISKESSSKWTVLKDATPKDVMLKGSLPQEALLKRVSTMETNPTDPGRVEPKKTTPKAVPPKGETSLEFEGKKPESREANPNSKPESLSKGVIPKDLTFQKPPSKEAAPQKARPENIASGGAALNVNPSKKIPTKKPIESTIKDAITKETKQDATLGDTTQERVAPGKASVKEITPKETMPEARLPKAGLPKKDAEKIKSPKESTTPKTQASKAVDFPQPASASTPKPITSSPSAASPLRFSSNPKHVAQSPVNLQGAAVSKMMTSSLTSSRRSSRSINVENLTTSSGTESETMPEARLPKGGLPKKDAEKIESPKESTTQKTPAPKAVDFPKPASASTPKHITSSPRATPCAASTQPLSSSPKLVAQSPVNLQGAAFSKMMTSSLTSPRRSSRSINVQNIATSSTTESETMPEARPPKAGLPKKDAEKIESPKESTTQKTTASKAVDFPKPTSASTPKRITSPQSALSPLRLSSSPKLVAQSPVNLQGAAVSKIMTSSLTSSKRSSPSINVQNITTSSGTESEIMPEARPPKAGLPKKDAEKIESPKESTTQKTPASKAVDFPQPASASTPKRITSSPTATPSAASPLPLSSSPKLVAQSLVNLQGAAFSKMMTSSLTSPRRSSRSVNVKNITSSSSESESESPASILRRAPQDQSPRISSTVSSFGEKTTPDKTIESSLIKGTIQVTANPRSQLKGAQQATATTVIKASSANKETGDKRVKPKPSSSMNSSTDSSGKKITAKEGEVVNTSVAEKVKQIKQNIDSSTQKLSLSSALSGSPKTIPSSNPKKANELPSVRISSPPPNFFDPDPDIDSKDQEDFMNVEELMSGDVIVLDEDGGQDMSGNFEDEDICPEDIDSPSDHEDIFTGTFGNVDGIYVSEDEILRGEWIVKDTEGEVEEDPELNYEEPGFEEMDFGEPDFSNMLSIDEVGGSDDEENVDEEVRDDDIDKVEEWEVLSEAEGD